MRDMKNFEYLHDLEARLRRLTHNEDERSLFIASAPDRVDSWALPMDGGIERQALDRIIQEMVKRGRLERLLPVEEVFRDEAVRDAYREVSNRAKLKPAFDTAMAAVEIWFLETAEKDNLTTQQTQELKIVIKAISWLAQRRKKGRALSFRPKGIADPGIAVRNFEKSWLLKGRLLGLVVIPDPFANMNHEPAPYLWEDLFEQRQRLQ